MTPEADTFPYRSAAAFRAALRDRLAALARSGGHGLDELQRQVAYDRLLARAFTAPDAERWVLKGAGALLARLPEARHSRDIDLAFATRATTRPDETERAADDAVSSLQAAINTDLGDFFRFEIPRTSPIDEAVKGRRIHVVAYLGARYATGRPTPRPAAHPRAPAPGLPPLPLPDHIADKLCAITEVHNRLDGPHASTRVKDLVDLVLIAGTQRVDAAALSLAIRVGTAHRGLPLPRRFTVPDPMRYVRFDAVLRIDASPRRPRWRRCLHPPSPRCRPDGPRSRQRQQGRRPASVGAGVP